ncbi:MAG: fused MFS/spermidine synthase [Candidatus Cloacimonetes bacterium]|nr:fused MFS/spermidine synthase [Candidatus Cloacimonadota bacterium]
MKKNLILALLIMGFSGIVAQILLLRELLITFYGNELSIGIILANWLILEAFGCFFIGKRAEWVKKPIQGFIILQLIFSLSLPFAVYLIRIFKEVIGYTAGEGLGLIPMLYSSFLILSLVSITHGALFTFGCKIYSLYSKKQGAKSIGKVYIYETLGTIAGGVAFTYLLIPYFHSVQIALSIALLNLILCVFLSGSFWHKKISNKILGCVSVIFTVFVAYILFSPKADEIHNLSIKHQWKGQELVHYQNSIYGNIVVTRRAEQYTFFSDGIPIITSPYPDITFVEEFVHLPMLFHPEPKEVLIISGGAGGVINEILKHPVERIDYVELDPLLLEVIEKFPTSLTKTELNHKKVNIKYTDGQLFVKRTSNKYDLVLLGLSNPSDLQVNRLFTKEFFSLVKEKLKEDGILVITLPGSLSYLGEELRNLNRCILNTLKNIFPHLKIIPGDGTNLFLSSKSETISLIDEKEIIQRLNERNLEVNLLTPAHIEYKLHPRWLNWFIKSLEQGTEKINQDFQPSGLFYSLSYWNALFSPSVRKLFQWFEKVNLRLFVIILSIFTGIFLLIRLRIKKLHRASIPICIVFTGFAGMIFDLVLIFTFQILYGYVFLWIGLLVTAFMVGVAVGGMIMTSLLERIKRDLISFVRIEFALVLFSGILPIIFLLFHPYLDRPVIYILLQIIFLVLSFISGLLIGSQFPLANKIYLKNSLKIGRTAGLLYSADLLGGWIGGLIGGVVLLPVLGLLKTCMVVLMFKVCSLIIVATSSRKYVTSFPKPSLGMK